MNRWKKKETAAGSNKVSHAIDQIYVDVALVKDAFPPIYGGYVRKWRERKYFSPVKTATPCVPETKSGGRSFQL